MLNVFTAVNVRGSCPSFPIAKSFQHRVDLCDVPGDGLITSPLPGRFERNRTPAWAREKTEVAAWGLSNIPIRHSSFWARTMAEQPGADAILAITSAHHVNTTLPTLRTRPSCPAPTPSCAELGRAEREHASAASGRRGRPDHFLQPYADASRVAVRPRPDGHGRRCYRYGVTGGAIHAAAHEYLGGGEGGSLERGRLRRAGESCERS